MSILPPITATGLGLLERADQRLARSAQAFTRSAEPAEPSESGTGTAADEPEPNGVVDAAVGVVYGRTEFEIGVKLIEVGRDTEKTLLDVVA